MRNRVNVLSGELSKLLPTAGTVLDVGCGDGTISKLLMNSNPAVQIRGIDVLERPACAVPMQVYDGVNFPFENDSFE